MKIITTKLSDFILSYPLEKIGSLDSLLFFDIETTGLDAATSHIYLIGAAFYSEDSWQIRQWFADSAADEENLLTSFLAFCNPYETLIHFNGLTFDLPFIRKRCNAYQLSSTLDGKKGLDIYRRAASLKNLLLLPDCKQKTIELFLGINREDVYSGGELISVYKDYEKNRDPETREILLLHNLDDMKGMLEILPLLAYGDLFNGKIKVKKVQANYYNDIHGMPRKELLMKVTLPSLIPVPVTGMNSGCHFKGVDDEGTLIVPIYDEEMKYFYANYQNYYYLPMEDTSIHKSLASFVDKEYRQQATASNCYTRKSSSFLPQWKIIFEPFFKREYKSKELFFELTDDIKKERDLFAQYANHLISHIFFQRS